MLGLRLFLCLVCVVAVTNSCIIGDKKEDQEVHVFHIGAPNDSEGNGPDIIELHIPESRRKREISRDHEYTSITCAVDDDCPPGVECILETSKCQSSSNSPISSKTTGHDVYLIPIN